MDDLIIRGGLIGSGTGARPCVGDAAIDAGRMTDVGGGLDHVNFGSWQSC